MNMVLIILAVLVTRQAPRVIWPLMSQPCNYRDASPCLTLPRGNSSHLGGRPFIYWTASPVPNFTLFQKHPVIYWQWEILLYFYNNITRLKRGGFSDQWVCEGQCWYFLQQETFARILCLSNLLPLKISVPLLWDDCIPPGSGSQGRKMSLVGNALGSHKVKSTHASMRKRKKWRRRIPLHKGWKLVGNLTIPSFL